jgi:hypothetical protein
MKTMPRIALALSAFAAVGAGAQTFYSGQADQDRRERNREEALAAYHNGSSTTTDRYGHTTAREETHKAANATRHGAHEVAEETREVTHKSANAVRRAGHKTAEEARHVSDKANAKVGPPMNAGKANPEGINPAGVSSASPTAPSNGTTK